MKILVVYPTPTHPVIAGNRKWVLSQSETLKKEGHDVYMLCINVLGMKEKRNDADIEKTKQYWGDHVFIYNSSFLFRLWSSLCMNIRKRFCRGYFKCDDLYTWGLSSFVSKINKVHHFDACIVNYYWLSKLLTKVQFPVTGINTHDVFSFRDLSTHTKNAWMCTTPDEEAKGIQRAEYVFALQDNEAAYFERIAPNTKVLTIYGTFKPSALPFKGNHNLIYLSADGNLNYDGFVWFYNEILPSLVKEFPDIVLVVGGRLCNSLDEFRSDSHISLIGQVEDPKELYQLGDVAINPCYEGTGLKIKTFESLAYGRIVMTHPHSVIGIYNKPNAPVFFSEKAEEWVEHLKKLWNDKSLLLRKMQESVDYINSMNVFIENEYKRFGE